MWVDQPLGIALKVRVELALTRIPSLFLSITAAPAVREFFRIDLCQ